MYPTIGVELHLVFSRDPFFVLMYVYVAHVTRVQQYLDAPNKSRAGKITGMLLEALETAVCYELRP